MIYLGGHVRGHVNFIRKLGDVHLEPTLYLFQDALISFTGHKRDSNTLGSETPGTTLYKLTQSETMFNN
jgi:hypothetical protein